MLTKVKFTNTRQISRIHILHFFSIAHFIHKHTESIINAVIHRKICIYLTYLTVALHKRVPGWPETWTRIQFQYRIAKFI